MLVTENAEGENEATFSQTICFYERGKINSSLCDETDNSLSEGTSSVKHFWLKLLENCSQEPSPHQSFE